MLRHMLVILLFPFVVVVGVLLQALLLVVLFLVAEMVGLESIVSSEAVTTAMFGVAFLVSLYGSWRISRKMW